MKLFQKIEKGIFVSRRNRFLVSCLIQNRPATAYLPNPGRLWELLLPGNKIFFVKHPTAKDTSTEYVVVAVEKNGTPVLLHTHLNNAVARHLIEQNMIPGLEGVTFVQPEVTFGKSRFDFLLRKGGHNIVLEVKSCTLFSGSTAMFPDAVTQRGKRHLEELASLSGKKTKSAVLFIVHSPTAHFFLPEYHTDLAFAKTLLSAKNKIMVKAISVEWGKDLTYGDAIHDLVIPWDTISKESHDRGSYIVILQLERRRKLSVGGLGGVPFQKGYYLYVGAARTRLTKRIDRHQRRRKNLFWHIDYLREHARFCAALPVRTSDNLECEIAQTLEKISGWSIPGFGSSDCTCKSHLFGMSDNPVHSPLFIKILLHFRIDRLDTLLKESLKYPIDNP